jgi:hypothetical protein
LGVLELAGFEAVVLADPVAAAGGGAGFFCTVTPGKGVLLVGIGTIGAAVVDVEGVGIGRAVEVFGIGIVVVAGCGVGPPAEAAPGTGIGAGPSATLSTGRGADGVEDATR